MREILFRGKRVDNGEWVEGYYVADTEWAKYYIYKPQHTGVYIELRAIKVHPESVGQFTGLLDKNGRMIFDCSLVKHNKNIYVVKWVDSLLRYRLVSVNHDTTLHARELDWLRNVSKYSEIIGNIHDNPELL